MSGPLFDSLASSYDCLRPQDENWQTLFDAIWEASDLRGRRVLDVGCGTGAFAVALAERGAKVWGVDASEEMLEQARARGRRGVGFKLGTAEALPFKDGWFERAVGRLVVHLVDRSRALPELARVLAPGGRAVVATFRPEHFDRIWLTRFFPSLPEVDRARFPEPEHLASELLSAGFSQVAIRPLTQPGRIARDRALERLRGRYISTLSLLPADEYEAGLARAEHELEDVTEYTLEWALVVADR